MIALEIIIPLWCLLQIILNIGASDFYSVFFTNCIYICASVILGKLNIPTFFLGEKEKQWLRDRAENREKEQ